MMASIKSSKIELPKVFQIELTPGWILGIEVDTLPTTYTLTHGKKSMTFYSEVAKDLCGRNYGIRLAQGRRHMLVPPEVLQAFSENEIFIMWYDSSVNHVTHKLTNQRS